MNSSIITKPLTRAGIFLGVGLGGFVDGIVFHQMLQFHNMLTGRIPKDTIANTEINMFWDGIFHSFTWIMTVIGIILLFRAHRVPNVLWTNRVFTGSLFLGWGLFNLIEGVIDHHILHLHHVVEAKGESIYDFLFLLSGAIFTIGGWWVIRSAKAAAVGHK
ncbi:DUF2243 domain-containing protein [Luteolibacter sp. AS25]|uniref:DUF2243 domain-containing protein n=1 Tax=Luteolibacter sp. AS25 TaxID=3135776 RepID=UPI00398AE483